MCPTLKSKPGSARSTILIENNRVRVTEWRFAKKGENTGWHRHEYDYIVVPLFDGFLEIDLGDGKSTRAELTSGVPYFRNVGVEHDVLNGNDFECAFIEIELLSKP
jgi:beta-alanine degradation protein BauB